MIKEEIKIQEQEAKGQDLKKKKEFPLLEVRGLRLSFPQYLEGFQESRLQVISDFSLNVFEGQIMGIVGASGAGKSLLADAILGVLPENAIVNGKLFYRGQEFKREHQKKWRGKEIFLIPQSVKSLDPLMKVGKQVKEVSANTRINLNDLTTVFHKLGLPSDTKDRYPFELSGGMMRRVLISMAILSKASLIIADESTPGLDLQTRNEILSEIKKLATEYHKGVLFITHDIEAAIKIADKIAVVNGGKVVEIADCNQFTGNGDNLSMAYTRNLWRALPENGFHLPSL